MITELQQENASLYALGAMSEKDAKTFADEMRRNGELAALVRDLQRAADALAESRATPPPAALKAKVLGRIDKLDKASVRPSAAALAGLSFIARAEHKGWKALPIPGAYIKLLSLEKERGYAVLLGKLDAGARYPAHVNAGPEDFFILTGDLVIGDRKLAAGDFHHADRGSQHGVNYSVEGCTLLAVLTTDDPLVALAMA
jgi:anti-sigma factor ChrR (cupin superfamily)